MIKKSYSLFFLLLLVLIARSQTRTWNGGNGNWNDASKWTPVGVPVETDILDFNSGTAAIFNVPAYSFKGIIVSGGEITLHGVPGGEQRVLLGDNSQKNALTVFKGASLTIANKLGLELFNNAYAKIDGTFIVSAGATLNLGESVVDGDGDVTIDKGAKLITAHAQGISLTGSMGAVRVAGKRIFDSNATYAYSGSRQQVTGLGLPAKVKNLTIDNASGSNQDNGVTLSRSTTVTGELMLKNGFIQSSEQGMLVVDDGGMVAVGSEQAFVAGPMRKIGNTPFTFPTGWVGSGGGRIPIGVSVMDSNASIQAEYKRLPATNKGNTINAPLHHISYCEYWELFPTGENVKGLVTLYRNAYSNCSPVSSMRDLSAARVARSNGTAWTQIGNSKDSIDGINGFVVSDSAGVTLTQKEKYFTLGNITTANDPLPVMFDHVIAYGKNNGVIIEWSNLTERDIATYFVERSGNGSDYSIVSQILPKSNRDDKASYQYFDNNPLPGLNFYRIKVIEKSMKIIFSKVLRVERDKEKHGISLYPNPVTNNQLIIALSGVREGNYNLTLFNSAGQNAFRDIINNKGSSTIKTLKLPSAIRPGIYNLVITGDNYRESKTLIVQ
ncbi:T9SS type A sorting domain-containing protein [Terrimonas pollutisoli]|uniref:T9SS type A sorting domain-containing protein n=1 Tax=Terrimonas pollutisoli TaxID=3034147 RepID=UPI0023ED36FF|nr:T9SS type A sorting domain-containing protein [Terrimonas sp. H1YJ31]